MNSDDLLRLGKWVGRGQAFAVAANHSLLGQARCWREIHDSGAYKSAGLTWDEFCQQQIGLARQNVDTLIKNLEELGAAFCQLSEIVPISAETFRAISPQIDGETIEIDGEKVPIVPENAVRIRGAVHQMRQELRKAKEKPAKNPIAVVHTRLDNCVAAVSRLGGSALETSDKEALRTIVEDSVLRLMAISERLAA
ncbi:MAG TPA: hypothetical protein VGH38_06045 [Bryobacteraceae bacterium]